MADEINPAPENAGIANMSLADLVKAVKMALKADEEIEEAKEALGTGDQDPAPTPAATDPAADPATKAMDALTAQVADLTKKLAVAQDTGAVISSIAARDALYAKVSPFIGAFDHASMTADALAAYAVKKLEVPCAAGSERVALDAWLHGRTPDSKKPAFAADSGAKVVDLITLWKESK